MIVSIDRSTVQPEDVILPGMSYFATHTFGQLFSMIV